MRDEIASLKSMWTKLETVANGSEGTGGDSSSAAGPDENDYW